MRHRTKIIAAAASVTAAVAVGGGVALASMTGDKPQQPRQNRLRQQKAVQGRQERQGHNAIVAAVAAQLHVSPALVSAALRPIFAAGHADPAEPSFAAAAHTLGVSTRQLADALTHAKLSLAPDAQASQASQASQSQAALSPRPPPSPPRSSRVTTRSSRPSPRNCTSARPWSARPCGRSSRPATPTRPNRASRPPLTPSASAPGN